MNHSHFSRRRFLSTAAMGVAAATLPRLGAQTVVSPRPHDVSAAPVPLATTRRGGHYRPPHRVGLGGVAIGNGFRPTSDAQCRETLEAAWDAGVRFYDTAPFYGAGLGERRFGHFLHTRPRSEYVLSTKVGRVYTAGGRAPGTLWADPSPFVYTYDYTAAGTRRSIEDSLQRFGVESIDLVFIHDLSPDNPELGERWTEQFEIAAKGAIPELDRLRDEGLIKGWGMGVNTIEPSLAALKAGNPDVMLCATQYTLVQHEEALNRLFPVCAERGVSVVVGAPMNAGFLAGVDRYNYGGTIPDGLPSRRARLAAIAREHGTDLRTAALQFSAAPEVVSTVIPGARSAQHVTENVASLTRSKIPAEFWAALKREGLVAPSAPTPSAV